MTDVELTVFFNEKRLQLLESYLRRNGNDAVRALQAALTSIYVQTVPYSERNALEQQLEAEAVQLRKAHEDAIRFSVVHLHDADNDCFLTSLTRTDFYSIACAYRLKLQELVGSTSVVDMVKHFGVVNEIDAHTFSSLCDSMPNDHRITALADLDFEGGTMSVCESSDNAWWTYSLHDVSTAAYKANRKQGIDLTARSEIFHTALEGKEIALAGDGLEIDYPEMNL